MFRRVDRPRTKGGEAAAETYRQARIERGHVLRDVGPRPDAVQKTTQHGWWKHRDRHFACAAIAYNVWLTSRGPDGVLTMRSLESGYGAAKILLSIHVLIIAWAMIPAEHWPLLKETTAAGRVEKSL